MEPKWKLQETELPGLWLPPIVLRSAVRDNIKNLQQFLDVLAPTDVKSSSYTLKEDFFKL
jgi:hypothetical protein